MKKEELYTPPFTITDEITSLVIAIGEAVGRLSVTSNNVPSPHLRKENRIKTIQSSLAIENNTLSVEQVTAIIEGKRVLGAPNEIKEVKNAVDAYELLFELNPFKEKDLLRAHKLMMSDLVRENGRFRSGGVGVFGEQGLVHLAPPAIRVPSLIGDLLHWAKTTKTHPLICSCVFHYEFEFIHPFADGNGRMGRMWQTLLLMQWNPIFAWIPVETIVKEHQQEYYNAIALCDKQGESTSFVSFMLRCLYSALQDFQKSDTESSTEGGTEKTVDKIIQLIKVNPQITSRAIAQKLSMAHSGVAKHLRNMQNSGIIRRVGPQKGGHWEVVGK
ncbi:MAG: Fic family protein [Bacteroidales bacterium]|nr:Fic family protein [Bacteroidales bacterium]